MLADVQLSFNAYTSASGWTAQAETTVATHNSDNVIDLTKFPRTILDSLYFNFGTIAAIVSAGGGTLQIDLVCSAAAALTTPTVLWSSGTLANATIVAWAANQQVYGFKMPQYVPLRYLGVQYTIGTAVFSAGSWRAFLSPMTPFYIPASY